MSLSGEVFKLDLHNFPIYKRSKVCTIFDLYHKRSKVDTIFVRGVHGLIRLDFLLKNHPNQT